MKKRIWLIPVILVSILVFTACNLPIAPTSTPQNLASTLAAQTLEAMMTQVAANPTQEQGTPAPTLVPATATPGPTNTPAPSPTATPVPIPCDAAAFVGDVNIPDGTVMAPGQKFNKTWRIKNTGSCTWTKDYAVVFVDGNAMGASAAVNLTGPVAPGQTVDITVPLTAPSQPGTYRGNFKLRNPNNVVFGTGANGQFAFYVEIKVVPPATGDGYNFVYNFCNAEWSSGAGFLTCGGKDGDAKGFVIYLDKPRLENGQVDNEPALLTAPQNINDGVIRGKYPAIKIKSGDRFRAIVGCEYNAKNCNVRFQLDYQIGDGAIQTLAFWNESYEGSFTSVDVDLNALAGNDVRFILTVLANGSADGDRALWLMPRILNVPPTPTPTTPPTATP
ncbi:NBR1-Ig-like domain-containing protein [Anaerolinea thermophila]|uniref:Nbr1 FW domain-containing protein n=1 Tax=Anaerolinea thermophila (strain DSM 14523 / JCM 11388 / NBRC 100420 / UNI-1) TaxID=926569 RepID=E8MY14_ANATU|nr:NBR1-Ig-like domain-containing protein [Anaerolinea thermophila]BAJ64245.1 hypothetical protein ANT_22190 [Anaerolinea thermophila UNI-1]